MFDVMNKFVYASAVPAAKSQYCIIRNQLTEELFHFVKLTQMLIMFVQQLMNWF